MADEARALLDAADPEHRARVKLLAVGRDYLHARDKLAQAEAELRGAVASFRAHRALEQEVALQLALNTHGLCSAVEDIERRKLLKSPECHTFATLCNATLDAALLCLTP